MAFKFPSLKRKKIQLSSPVIKDLPSVDWADLTDKEKIGRGSFGSVFVAKYGQTSENDKNVFSVTLPFCSSYQEYKVSKPFLR